jgi:hypothetical protein
MLLLSKMAIQICKKPLHWISKYIYIYIYIYIYNIYIYIQNGYLTRRAKEKRLNVVTPFKGAILFFIISLTCFLFFPNLFPLFKG